MKEKQENEDENKMKRKKKKSYIYEQHNKQIKNKTCLDAYTKTHSETMMMVEQ